MCLLHTMMKMKSLFTPSLLVSVVHFSHNKRSVVEMEKELKLVKDWSDFYKISFYHRELKRHQNNCELESSDNTIHMSKIKDGFQNYARNWRRNECMKIIQEIHFDKHKHNQSKNKNQSQSQYQNNEIDYCIVTGHHEDDQIEGLLMKLLRGTHISRLTPVCNFILTSYY